MAREKREERSRVAPYLKKKPRGVRDGQRMGTNTVLSCSQLITSLPPGSLPIFLTVVPQLSFFVPVSSSRELLRGSGLSQAHRLARIYTPRLLIRLEEISLRRYYPSCMNERLLAAAFKAHSAERSTGVESRITHCTFRGFTYERCLYSRRTREYIRCVFLRSLRSLFHSLCNTCGLYVCVKCSYLLLRHLIICFLHFMKNSWKYSWKCNANCGSGICRQVCIETISDNCWH